MLNAYLQTSLAVLRSNLRRLPCPYKVTLALTYRCNFRCRSCLTWRRPPAGEMTLEEIETFFRRQNYFSWVDLTGGEISLREDLPEVLAAAAGYSHRLILLHFPTNGWLTEEIIRGVRAVRRKAGLRFVVTVSLDGPPDLHDRLKGMKGSWERAVETYSALRAERGVEVFLGMTLTRENLHSRDETISAVRRRVAGFSPADLHFNLAYRSFFYDNLTIDPDPGAAALPLLGRLAAAYGILPGPRSFLERTYLRRARKYIRTGFCPLPCQALSASCFIDPDGKVYPCTAYDRVLGDLRGVGFDLGRLWSHPDTVALQKDIVNGICPHCWTPCEAYQTILGNLFRRFLPGAAGRAARRYTPKRINSR